MPVAVAVSTVTLPPIPMLPRLFVVLDPGSVEAPAGPAQLATAIRPAAIRSFICISLSPAGFARRIGGPQAIHDACKDAIDILRDTARGMTGWVGTFEDIGRGKPELTLTPLDLTVGGDNSLKGHSSGQIGSWHWGVRPGARRRRPDLRAASPGGA